MSAPLHQDTPEQVKAGLVVGALYSVPALVLWLYVPPARPPPELDLRSRVEWRRLWPIFLVYVLVSTLVLIAMRWQGLGFLLLTTAFGAAAALTLRESAGLVGRAYAWYYSRQSKRGLMLHRLVAEEPFTRSGAWIEATRGVSFLLWSALVAGFPLAALLAFSNTSGDSSPTDYPLLILSASFLAFIPAAVVWGALWLPSLSRIRAHDRTLDTRDLASLPIIGTFAAASLLFGIARATPLESGARLAWQVIYPAMGLTVGLIGPCAAVLLFLWKGLPLARWRFVTAAGVAELPLSSSTRRIELEPEPPRERKDTGHAP